MPRDGLRKPRDTRPATVFDTGGSTLRTRPKHTEERRSCPHDRSVGRRVIGALLRHWRPIAAGSAGILACAWLLMRSGVRPSRLSYPCQQAALAAALTALPAPLAAALAGDDTRWAGRLRRIRHLVAIAALAVFVSTLYVWARPGSVSSVTILTPPARYAPEVFLVNHTRGAEPTRFGGVDDLLTLMGVHGFKWHRSANESFTAGPDGLIDPDDIVLLKINAQWPQRGGTNTDVIRGVIRRIVEHPDGFTGEVIVVDNGQGSGRVNRTQNNAEDRTQSAQDVANDFAAEEWAVSAWTWDSFRYSAVGEFNTGDPRNGYVVSPNRDPQTQILVSYPKFRTPGGAYLSYKHGVWDPSSETYDADRLVVINMPVFKTHYIYAITGAVKNHMGVVTNGLGTDSHNRIRDGGLGSVMAEARMPDLTIMDCIWILAIPGSGPDASYADATRRDQLLASTDPVALDAWATKHIMIPQIIANGYNVNNYGATQDPDNPASEFRIYLDLTMNELLFAGIDTTNNYDAVRLHVWTGDDDRDGDVDLTDINALPTCLLGPANVSPQNCTAFDADTDGDVDLFDFHMTQRCYSEPPQ